MGEASKSSLMSLGSILVMALSLIGGWRAERIGSYLGSILSTKISLKPHKPPWQSLAITRFRFPVTQCPRA